MHVFVTGATGWIGSAAVGELLGAGHAVTAIARSEKSATTLTGKGAGVLRGDLDDLDALRRGAADADAVLHLANKHDWANPAESNRAERASVEALAEELSGSDRPLAFASGVAGIVLGPAAVESDDNPNVGPDSHRGGAEVLALEYATRGVQPMALRFAPTVHGMGDHGFISLITDAARRTGVSGYVGDGSHAWSAVHRGDAATLIRTALERPSAGARLHVVGEEAVSTRDIAEAIGQSLGVPTRSIAPEEALERFGFIGRFFSHDLSASSARTRETFSWKPTGPTLLDDIAAGAYARH